MDSDQKILAYFIKNHPQDTARTLEHLGIAEIASLVNEIPVLLGVEIFRWLEQYTTVRCLELISSGKSTAIFEKLPIDISASLLRRMPKEWQQAKLKQISAEIAEPLKNMLQFPEDTAAAMMDPLIFTLPEDITIKEALKRVRNRPEKAIYYLYILKRDHTLAGVLNIRELMLANKDVLLSSVMHSDVISVPAHINVDAVLNHSGWLEFHALPVVEQSGIFWGAIRYETLRRVEKNSHNKNQPGRASSTSNALGELYRIGFSGLIRGVADSNTSHEK